MADVCAPNHGNLTIFHLLNVETEKDLREHLQGLKLLSGDVEETALLVSFTYSYMGLRVPWIEYSLHIVQVRKLRPKQVGPAPLGMKPVRSHRAPLLEGLILS